MNKFLVATALLVLHPAVQINSAAAAAADQPARLPEWAPAVGHVNSIAQNKLVDVDPCPSRDCGYNRPPFGGQLSVFNAWCGGVFAPSFGEFGSIVTMGGGHGDYGGNEVYRFSFATRRWTRITEPHPTDPDNPAPSDPVWGDYDDHSPLSSHNYGCLVALSGPEANNKNGKLIYPLIGAGGRAAGNYPRAHELDLDTLKWSRIGSKGATPTQEGTNGTCAYDPIAHAVWAFPSATWGANKLDLKVGDWTDKSTTDVAHFPWGTVACYDPSSKLILLFDRTGGEGKPAPPTLCLFDPATQKFKKAIVEGTPPCEPGFGFEYCDVTDHFYLYGSPARTNELQVLHRPRTGGVMNGTWTFSSETFQGKGPSDAHRVYGKFRWVPPLRSFVSYGATDGDVYLFRPDGT